jgi:hypothetical protein
MTDPLSITVGAIGLIGALGATGKAANKLLKLRKAPHELMQLYNEVRKPSQMQTTATRRLM